MMKKRWILWAMILTHYVFLQDVSAQTEKPISSLKVVTENSQILLTTKNNEVTTSSVSATQNSVQKGYLNVFSDEDNSDIYIDGQYEGKNILIKKPLDPGEHQVQLKQNGKVVYSTLALLSSGKTTSVVADQFVNMLTKTPSKGAIDREARRLKDSRGNLGIGMRFSTAYPAASIKWWHQRWGIQGLFLGDLKDKQHYGNVGARAMYALGDRVFQEDVLQGYFYMGGGGIVNSVAKWQNYYDFGLGIEAKLGELANKLLLRPNTTYVVNKNNDFLRDLFILGVLNLFYTSIDVNFFNQNNQIQTEFNVGLHVYF